MNELSTQQNTTDRKGHCPCAWRIAILCALAAVVILAGMQFYHASGEVHFDEEFAAQTYDGMTTYYLNSSNHSNVSIIYLHGQDTADTIHHRQWRLLNRIANETDAEIITPDIASLPASTNEEIYASLYAWYVPWQHGNDSRILYIAGDDENSPLLTGFMEYLESHGARLPNGTAAINNLPDFPTE